MADSALQALSQLSIVEVVLSHVHSVKVKTRLRRVSRVFKCAKYAVSYIINYFSLYSDAWTTRAAWCKMRQICLIDPTESDHVNHVLINGDQIRVVHLEAVLEILLERIG